MMVTHPTLQKSKYQCLIGLSLFMLMMILSAHPIQSQGTLSADLNGDNQIDEQDLYILLGSNGSKHGDEKYNLLYDLNPDNKLDHLDVLEFVQQWHKTPAPRVPTTAEDLTDLWMPVPKTEDESWKFQCANPEAFAPLCSYGIQIYANDIIDLTGTPVLPVNIAIPSGDFSICPLITQEDVHEIPQLDLSIPVFEEESVGYTIPDQTVVFSTPVVMASTEVISGATFGGDTSMSFQIEFELPGKTKIRQEMELPVTYETTWIDCSKEGDWSQSCLLLTVNVSILDTTYSFQSYTYFNGQGPQASDCEVEKNGAQLVKIEFETVPPGEAKPGDLLAYFENPSPAQYDHFGWELGVLGNYLIVGVPFHDEGMNKDLGEAYLFDGNTQELLTTFHKQTPYDPLFDVGFGTAVAGIDHFVLVADIREVTTGGAVYIFDADPKSPTFGEPHGEPIVNPKAGVYFGNDIVVGKNIVAIGAESGSLGGNNPPGFIALYQFDPETLTFNRNPQIIGNPSASGKDFGSIMAITDDLLLVGDSAYKLSDVVITGIAYVYGSDPSNPNYGELIATLNNPNATPEAYEYFGWAVAISDSLLAVAAYGHDPGDGYEPGTIYLFDGNSESPTFGDLLQTIRNPMTYGGNFPSDIVFIGDYLAASSNGANAIYFFNPKTGNIELTIDNPSEGYGDFGSSLAVTAEGNLLAADDDADEGTNSNGIVYLFKGPDGLRK